MRRVVPIAALVLVLPLALAAAWIGSTAPTPRPLPRALPAKPPVPPAGRTDRRGEVELSFVDAAITRPRVVGWTGEARHRAPLLVVRFGVANRSPSAGWKLMPFRARIEDEFGRSHPSLSASELGGELAGRILEPGDYLRGVVAFRRPGKAARRFTVTIPGVFFRDHSLEPAEGDRDFRIAFGLDEVERADGE